jgi:class 3 adenylate cyclase
VVSRASSKNGTAPERRPPTELLEPRWHRPVALAAIAVAALTVAVVALRSLLPVARLERLGWLIALALVTVIAALRLRQLAASLARGRVERERLEKTLGRFVSPRVAEVINSDPRPTRREVTVLFCDLRGFTFLCERERPEDVVDLLDSFYEEACPVIEARGGLVNKLLGDGMLALFGAPHDHPEHADAAVLAALELMDLVARLRERGGVWTHLAAGIGLDTGEVVLGPVGSHDRAEYTAIGSPVNRAARLQNLAERESRRIIVSSATKRALRGRGHRLVSVGMIELKGFPGPEEVFYLSGRGTSEFTSAHGKRAMRLPETRAGELTPSSPTLAPGLALLASTIPDPEPTGETGHDTPPFQRSTQRYQPQLNQSTEMTRPDALTTAISDALNVSGSSTLFGDDTERFTDRFTARFDKVPDRGE